MTAIRVYTCNEFPVEQPSDVRRRLIDLPVARVSIAEQTPFRSVALSTAAAIRNALGDESPQ